MVRSTGLFLYLPDCPNGFINLNNKCYLWQAPDQLDQHLRLCHLSRGNLLQVSPLDPVNELVAKKMMALYSSVAIYAGELASFYNFLSFSFSASQLHICNTCFSGISAYILTS